MRRIYSLITFCVISASLISQTLCENGVAGSFECHNTHLLSHVSTSDLNGGSSTELNDIWGWTDPNSGREFALVGLRTGTAFVEMTDPTNPIVIGKLPTHTSNSTWRDVKVYQNHAFIGSEAGGHGMQIFDLTQLLSSFSGYQTFTNTAHYAGFGDSHNIVINEESGFAYGVGADFSGGLHVVDISDPLNPSLEGGFSDDGYTHDAQVVIYNGPDTTHVGEEIAFACNENTLTVVHVTDKSDMYELDKKTYAGERYTHQGWLTEDHKYFLMDDELDELQLGVKTTTFIWDVQDLENIQLIGTFVSDLSCIDHNQYVKDDWVYQSNYTGGLRILSLKDVANANLEEVGFFDTYPANNGTNFNGTWSNYPFFNSQNVIVSDINSGLYIVRPVFVTVSAVENNCPGLDIEYSVLPERGLNGAINLSLENLPAGLTFEFSEVTTTQGDEVILTIGNTSILASGSYTFNLILDDGLIAHREEISLEIPGNLSTPENLSSSLDISSVNLQWDPVPGTIACKIRGREVGTSLFQHTPIFFGTEPSSYSVSTNFLQPETTYEWQVICGCSVSPIVASPWSGFDTFTTPGESEFSSKEIQLQDELNFYPIPAQNLITLQWNLGETQQANLEIYDMEGRLIDRYNQITKKTLEINIEHLTKGIYFARLSDGALKAIGTRFIVE
ncbi:MAG: choice-of-anchor B family protein [Bacteroidota bacterium]